MRNSVRIKRNSQKISPVTKRQLTQMLVDLRELRALPTDGVELLIEVVRYVNAEIARVNQFFANILSFDLKPEVCEAVKAAPRGKLDPAIKDAIDVSGVREIGEQVSARKRLSDSRYAELVLLDQYFSLQDQKKNPFKTDLVNLSLATRRQLVIELSQARVILTRLLRLEREGVKKNVLEKTGVIDGARKIPGLKKEGAKYALPDVVIKSIQENLKIIAENQRHLHLAYLQHKDIRDNKKDYQKTVFEYYVTHDLAGKMKPKLVPSLLFHHSSKYFDPSCMRSAALLPLPAPSRSLLAGCRTNGEILDRQAEFEQFKTPSKVVTSNGSGQALKYAEPIVNSFMRSHTSFQMALKAIGQKQPRKKGDIQSRVQKVAFGLLQAPSKRHPLSDLPLIDGAEDRLYQFCQIANKRLLLLRSADYAKLSDQEKEINVDEFDAAYQNAKAKLDIQNKLIDDRKKEALKCIDDLIAASASDLAKQYARLDQQQASFDGFVQNCVGAFNEVLQEIDRMFSLSTYLPWTAEPKDIKDQQADKIKRQRDELAQDFTMLKRKFDRQKQKINEQAKAAEKAKDACVKQLEIVHQQVTRAVAANKKKYTLHMQCNDSIEEALQLEILFLNAKLNDYENRRDRKMEDDRCSIVVNAVDVIEVLEAIIDREEELEKILGTTHSPRTPRRQEALNCLDRLSAGIADIQPLFESADSDPHEKQWKQEELLKDISTVHSLLALMEKDNRINKPELYQTMLPRIAINLLQRYLFALRYSNAADVSQDLNQVLKMVGELVEFSKPDLEQFNQFKLLLLPEEQVIVDGKQAAHSLSRMLQVIRRSTEVGRQSAVMHSITIGKFVSVWKNLFSAKDVTQATVSDVWIKALCSNLSMAGYEALPCDAQYVRSRQDAQRKQVTDLIVEFDTHILLPTFDNDSHIKLSNLCNRLQENCQSKMIWPSAVQLKLKEILSGLSDRISSSKVPCHNNELLLLARFLQILKAHYQATINIAASMEALIHKMLYTIYHFHRSSTDLEKALFRQYPELIQNYYQTISQQQVEGGTAQSFHKLHLAELASMSGDPTLINTHCAEILLEMLDDKINFDEIMQAGLDGIALKPNEALVGKMKTLLGESVGQVDDRSFEKIFFILALLTNDKTFDKHLAQIQKQCHFKSISCLAATSTGQSVAPGLRCMMDEFQNAYAESKALHSAKSFDEILKPLLNPNDLSCLISVEPLLKETLVLNYLSTQGEVDSIFNEKDTEFFKDLILSCIQEKSSDASSAKGDIPKVSEQLFKRFRWLCYEPVTDAQRKERDWLWGVMMTKLPYIQVSRLLLEAIGLDKTTSELDAIIQKVQLEWSSLCVVIRYLSSKASTAKSTEALKLGEAESFRKQVNASMRMMVCALTRYLCQVGNDVPNFIRNCAKELFAALPATFFDDEGNREAVLNVLNDFADRSPASYLMIAELNFGKSEQVLQQKEQLRAAYWLRYICSDKYEADPAFECREYADNVAKDYSNSPGSTEQQLQEAFFTGLSDYDVRAILTSLPEALVQCAGDDLPFNGLDLSRLEFLNNVYSKLQYYRRETLDAYPPLLSEIASKHSRAKAFNDPMQLTAIMFDKSVNVTQVDDKLCQMIKASLDKQLDANLVEFDKQVDVILLQLEVKIAKRFPLKINSVLKVLATFPLLEQDWSRLHALLSKDYDRAKFPMLTYELAVFAKHYFNLERYEADDQPGICDRVLSVLDQCKGVCEGLTCDLRAYNKLRSLFIDFKYRGRFGLPSAYEMGQQELKNIFECREDMGTPLLLSVPTQIQQNECHAIAYKKALLGAHITIFSKNIFLRVLHQVVCEKRLITQNDLNVIWQSIAAELARVCGGELKIESKGTFCNLMKEVNCLIQLQQQIHIEDVPDRTSPDHDSQLELFMPLSVQESDPEVWKVASMLLKATLITPYMHKLLLDVFAEWSGKQYRASQYGKALSDATTVTNVNAFLKLTIQFHGDQVLLKLLYALYIATHYPLKIEEILQLEYAAKTHFTDEFINKIRQIRFSIAKHYWQEKQTALPASGSGVGALILNGDPESSDTLLIMPKTIISSENPVELESENVVVLRQGQSLKQPGPAFSELQRHLCNAIAIAIQIVPTSFRVVRKKAEKTTESESWTVLNLCRAWFVPFLSSQHNQRVASYQLTLCEKLFSSHNVQFEMTIFSLIYVMAHYVPKNFGGPAGGIAVNDLCYILEKLLLNEKIDVARAIVEFVIQELENKPGDLRKEKIELCRFEEFLRSHADKLVVTETESEGYADRVTTLLMRLTPVDCGATDGCEVDPYSSRDVRADSLDSELSAQSGSGIVESSTLCYVPSSGIKTKVVFTIDQQPADGDCCFHAVGVSRGLLKGKLKKFIEGDHSDSEYQSVREWFADDIAHLLLSGGSDQSRIFLEKKLQQCWERYKAELDTHQANFDRLFRAFRDRYSLAKFPITEEEKQLRANGLANYLLASRTTSKHKEKQEQSVDIYLAQYASNDLKIRLSDRTKARTEYSPEQFMSEILNKKFSQQSLVSQELFKCVTELSGVECKIKAFYQDKEVFKDYVGAITNPRLGFYGSHFTLRGIAELYQRNFRIWREGHSEGVYAATDSTSDLRLQDKIVAHPNKEAAEFTDILWRRAESSERADHYDKLTYQKNPINDRVLGEAIAIAANSLVLGSDSKVENLPGPSTLPGDEKSSQGEVDNGEVDNNESADPADVSSKDIEEAYAYADLLCQGLSKACQEKTKYEQLIEGEKDALRMKDGEIKHQEVQLSSLLERERETIINQPTTYKYNQFVVAFSVKAFEQYREYVRRYRQRHPHPTYFSEDGVHGSDDINEAARKVAEWRNVANNSKNYEDQRLLLNKILCYVNEEGRHPFFRTQKHSFSRYVLRELCCAHAQVPDEENDYSMESFFANSKRSKHVEFIKRKIQPANYPVSTLSERVSSVSTSSSPASSPDVSRSITASTTNMKTAAQRLFECIKTNWEKVSCPLHKSSSTATSLAPRANECNAVGKLREYDLNSLYPTCIATNTNGTYEFKNPDCPYGRKNLEYWSIEKIRQRAMKSTLTSEIKNKVLEIRLLQADRSQILRKDWKLSELALRANATVENYTKAYNTALQTAKKLGTRSEEQRVSSPLPSLSQVESEKSVELNIQKILNINVQENSCCGKALASESGLQSALEEVLQEISVLKITLCEQQGSQDAEKFSVLLNDFFTKLFNKVSIVPADDLQDYISTQFTFVSDEGARGKLTQLVWGLYLIANHRPSEKRKLPEDVLRQISRTMVGQEPLSRAVHQFAQQALDKKIPFKDWRLSEQKDARSLFDELDGLVANASVPESTLAVVRDIYGQINSQGGSSLSSKKHELKRYLDDLFQLAKDAESVDAVFGQSFNPTITNAGFGGKLTENNLKRLAKAVVFLYIVAKLDQNSSYFKDNPKEVEALSRFLKDKIGAETTATFVDRLQVGVVDAPLLQKGTYKSGIFAQKRDVLGSACSDPATLRALESVF